MRNPFKGRQYFYVITKSKDGRLVVWMKDSWRTESEANQAAFNAIKGRMFVVVAKNFKDVSRVTQENKSLQLEESADLDGSIKRAVHTPSRFKFDDKQEDKL